MTRRSSGRKWRSGRGRGRGGGRCDTCLIISHMQQQQQLLPSFGSKFIWDVNYFRFLQQQQKTMMNKITIGGKIMAAMMNWYLCSLNVVSIIFKISNDSGSHREVLQTGQAASWKPSRCCSPEESQDRTKRNLNLKEKWKLSMEIDWNWNLLVVQFRRVIDSELINSASIINRGTSFNGSCIV